MFQIKHYRLPHEGVIPGARGHKKIVIPRGEKVFCIVYGTKIYWAAYLNEAQAIQSLENLKKNKLDIKTLVEWNFKDAIPVRVARPPATI